jgi:Fic family protein
MKSFAPGFLEKQLIPQNLLRSIRLLGEYKGKEEIFKQQSPQVLETLRHAAVIQSTESSNRIEGVVASHDRIVKIVQKKVKPANRSEQEIAGYRDVLNTIHANHAHMKFSVNLILQMHRLYFFSKVASRQALARSVVGVFSWCDVVERVS